MSNKKSIEIYSLTENREKTLWKDCIFVFDTSSLLEFYYYPLEISDQIHNKIFSELKNQERLWIPQRVEYEFWKNREKKIREPIQKYKDLINNDHSNDKKDKNNDKYYVQKIDQSIKHIEQIFNEEIKQIYVQLNALSEQTKKQNRHPYFEDTLFINNFQNIITNFKTPAKNELEQLHDMEKLKTAFENFKDKIIEEIENKEKEINNNFQNFTGTEKDKDPVFKIFNCFQVGEEYSFHKLLEIVQEGQVRYKSKIPPGYMDENDKSSIRIYGDLIVWKQIIDYAKNKKKNIILINNDIKEDWWDKTRKETQPREELIKEFYDYTDGMEIWMYNLSRFIHKAKQLLDAKVDQTVLEKVKEIEEEQLKQKEEEIAEVLIPTQKDVTWMPLCHHPQEQNYWQEQIEVENSLGQRQIIQTNLLRIYPERFNTYDAYMDIPMSINPDIQKVISPRLGKTWKVIAGPKESSIMGYFRGNYTSNNPPAWEFRLRLN